MDNFKYNQEYCTIITPPDMVNNECINVLCVNFSQTDVETVYAVCKVLNRSYNFYLWHDGMDVNWYTKVMMKSDAILTKTIIDDARVINTDINTDIYDMVIMLENKEF